MKILYKLIVFIFLFNIFIFDFAYSADVVYRGIQYRDPFKSLLPRVSTPETRRKINLDVQGIIWDSDRPNAIINNRVLNIGDVIDNAEILNITRKGVLILFQGETFLLNTGQSR